MNFVVFDYECPCGSITEEIVRRPAPDNMPCLKCGGTARKIYSARVTGNRNRDGNGIIDENPAWINGPSADPRDPNSPSRGIVSLPEYLAGREQGITSRSQRSALMNLYGLRNENE